ncbi:SusC/RagA family TonB-linked outer membrane protein [Larkinella bovis]|uniref:SusC/RagA family TonB-linked outer membrane protein n=1 Tax=Larkinella bovis TaxID=683041 RepID=A0ABW0I5F0_9BACT
MLLLLFCPLIPHAQTLLAANQTSREISGSYSVRKELVSGRITDEKGVGIPGVNVVEKGTTNGTITDSEGSYKLTVAGPGSVIVVSFLGYVSQERQVGSNAVLDIQLATDNKVLSEVIVVGYGTQKKSDVTGAISQISAEKVKAVPVVSAEQVLQGQAAGVDVVAAGNAPGSGMTVRVRGQRSIQAGNDPLYVVDGIPFDGGLNQISPNDIQSVEVLKDASAAAIYGSRAANGVVLITTKRGSSGKTQVSVDSYYGVQNIQNQVKVLGAEDFLSFRKIARKTDNLNVLLAPEELANYRAGKSVNWQDLLLTQNAPQQNHQIGVSGGNEKTKFLVSLNYLKQNGIIKPSDFERGSLRINLDHQINKTIKFGVSSLFTRSLTNTVDVGNALVAASQISPLGDVRDADGKLLLYPTQSEQLVANPMTDIANNINKTWGNRVFLSLYGELALHKNLTYRLNFGPDLSFTKNGRYIGSETNAKKGGLDEGQSNRSDSYSYTLENVLRYSKIFEEKHNLNVTFVHSIQNRKYDYTNVSAQGFPTNLVEWQKLSSGAIKGFDTGFEDWKLLSYMARVNYGFNEKYLVTLAARMDGSSRFGDRNKFGFFPSASLAWRVIEEDWVQGATTWLSDLKLRASYGLVGNTAIAPYQTLGGLSRSAYLFGSNPALGFGPSSLPSPDLKWETSRQFNIGLDFGILKNRVTGSAEYYMTNTDDLLLSQALPPTTGYANIMTNIGATRNQGFELSLQSTNINSSSGFKWTTDLNLATNRNKIRKLLTNNTNDVGNAWFIGQPIQVYYDHRYQGIWQASEAEEAKKYERQVGQIKVEDVNADGKINADDRVILGSPFPKWTGGLTNTFGYKGWSLSVFVYARQNFQIKSDLYSSNLDNLNSRFNIPVFVDYWTPENPNTRYPRTEAIGTASPNISSLGYVDGSYVRVRTITLSHTFASSLIQKAKIQSLRVYGSLNNPFNFTNFKGWDTEAGSAYGSYPSTKLFLLGVNLTL